MAKTIRSVASSEPNQKLQNLLFLFAQKHELFELETSVFNTGEKKIQNSLDEARKLLILPIRVFFYH
jgi:hypothetical protein